MSEGENAFIHKNPDTGADESIFGEISAEERAAFIARRAKIIGELQENEKINFAGGGLYEFESHVASAGVEHHRHRAELSAELVDLNRKLRLPTASREELTA